MGKMGAAPQLLQSDCRSPHTFSSYYIRASSIMPNPSLSSDLTISQDDVMWKISSVARNINVDPMNEALYYTLLTPIENVLSSSSKLDWTAGTRQTLH